MARRSKDPIVEKVVDDLRDRSETGIRDYGTTLADNNMTLEEWLVEATHEALDLALYLTRIQAKIKERRYEILEEITAQDQKDGLYDVVGRSEQLLAFAKWLDEETIDGLLAEPEYYVKRYLSQ